MISSFRVLGSAFTVGAVVSVALACRLTVPFSPPNCCALVPLDFDEFCTQTDSNGNIVYELCPDYVITDGALSYTKYDKCNGNATDSQRFTQTCEWATWDCVDDVCALRPGSGHAGSNSSDCRNNRVGEGICRIPADDCIGVPM